MSLFDKTNHCKARLCRNSRVKTRTQAEACEKKFSTKHVILLMIKPLIQPRGTIAFDFINIKEAIIDTALSAPLQCLPSLIQGDCLCLDLVILR